MPMTSKQMVKLLQNGGFEKVRQNGSHLILCKGCITISVPMHNNKDLRTGLEKALLKKARIASGIVNTRPLIAVQVFVSFFFMLQKVTDFCGLVKKRLK